MTEICTRSETLDRVEPRLGGWGIDLVVSIGTILGVLALAGVLAGFGYWSAPVDKQFMGIILNVPDTAQYLSWAREFSENILIEDKLTAERGIAVYFNLFWFFVGRLSSRLGLGYAETVQLVQPFAGAFFLGSVYWFVGLVEPRRWRRCLTFLVIAVGGGLGWILVLLKHVTGQLSFPLDLYVAEPNTFLTVVAFPFQAVAGGMLIVILGLAALAFERRSFRLAALAGLLGLVLGLSHGYDLLIVDCVVASLALSQAFETRFTARPVALGALIGGLSAPAAAYTVYITRVSPIWRGVLAQYGNAGVFTPRPFHLLILLGLPLIVLIATPRKRSSGRPLEPRECLVGCWLVVGLLLLYIPTNFQIKMLSDWQVPIGILSVRALDANVAAVMRNLPGIRRWRWDLALGALLVGAVIPANLYLYAWRFVDLRRHDYPYYLYRDDVAAMKWLEQHAGPSDVVLSSLTIGQYIPALTGRRAFLGHWAETLDFYRKQRDVARFYAAGGSDSARFGLLREFDVRYIYEGAPEQSLGGFDPARSPCFERVFSSPHTSVYEVRPTCLAGTLP